MADWGQVLREHGLTGSYQVHEGPLEPPLDPRVHHVFLNCPFTTKVTSGWIGQTSLTVLREGRLTEFGPGVQPGENEVWVVKALGHSVGIHRLVSVVERLRGPGGCPWDQAQTHDSLRNDLLEEAYELFDAIDQRNDEGLQEELGDVLLQVLLHSSIAAERQAFDLDAVAEKQAEKLIRRHPHVFGDVDAPDAETVLQNWDRVKRAERANQSILQGVPRTLPALLRAIEVSKRAARAGFDWPNVDAIWEKFDEERQEWEQAANAADQEAEFGDLLFALVNIARWRGIDPEAALQDMVNRFIRRFTHMEESAQSLNTLSAENWEELWQAAKNAENGGERT